MGSFAKLLEARQLEGMGRETTSKEAVSLNS